MIDYIITFAAGVAAGAVLETVLLKIQESTVKGHIKSLRDCFGEPMCTTTFTFKEVKEWIKAREDSLQAGSKAIVLKANSKTMGNLGKELNLDGVENYLIMAVVDKDSGDIQDSVLIKYERLDQALENALAKGNGVLVVEG